MTEGDGRKHFLLCSTCQRSVNATERGCVEDHPESGPSTRVTLVRCDLCGTALLLAQEDHGDGWDEMVRVWPDGARHLSTEVPKPLQDEHNEARRCFDAKAYTATAVMVGRTLEGMCAQHGVHDKVLMKSLEKMRDKGLIDQRLFDWATELRSLRNAGAHFTGGQVTRQDAADALALSERMLDYMYVLTMKFDARKVLE